MLTNSSKPAMRTDDRRDRTIEEILKTSISGAPVYEMVLYAYLGQAYMLYLSSVTLPFIVSCLFVMLSHWPSCIVFSEHVRAP